MNYLLDDCGYSGLSRDVYPELRQKGNVERFINIEHQAFAYIWRLKLKVTKGEIKALPEKILTEAENEQWLKELEPLLREDLTDEEAIYAGTLADKIQEFEKTFYKVNG